MNMPYKPGTRPRPEKLPEPWQSTGLHDRKPWDYDPDPGLVDAVNVALLLGKPLLLTGEPGSGKTTFAYSVAWEKGYNPPLEFETRSTSVARDLFYTFDTLGLFKAAYLKEGAAQPDDFITYNALGSAIIMAEGRTEHPQLKRRFQHAEGMPSVVLIDEVDKAPRDFPNDILNELERMYFKIPELNQPGSGQAVVRAPETMKPVVIITSNSEKQLPPAFLRRCVYYNVPFPDRQDSERLKEIAVRRMGDFVSNDSLLLTQCLDFFYTLRENHLVKKPATAELIDWLIALRGHCGASRDAPLNKEWVRETWYALLKNSADMDRAPDILEKWSNHKGQ